MRKFIITCTVIVLIISIIGTGVVVYIDINSPLSETPVISGE